MLVIHSNFIIITYKSQSEPLSTNIEVKVLALFRRPIICQIWAESFAQEWLSPRFWHKRGHVYQLLLYFIECWRYCITTRSWTFWSFFIISLNGIIKAIFVVLDKVIWDFDSLVQWLEIWLFIFVITRSRDLNMLAFRYKMLWFRWMLLF